MSNHTEAVDDIKKAKDALDSISTTTKHQYVSFIKSGIRIVACGFLAYYEIQIAAVLFAFAEVLGVAEELV